jgi:hypothetical protein
MPGLPCVFIVTTSGCVLQGDRMALDIQLAAGAQAHVTTQSATKIHSMEANYAAQEQTIRLDDEAYLEFVPDVIIPHRGSRFISKTRITIAPSATMLFSEILLPGRKHHHVDETFGFDVFSSLVAACNPRGRELFAEKLVIEPRRQMLRRAGAMGPFDVFGNVFLLTPKVPEQLSDGVVYHSPEFELAALLCACGCGHRVMLLVPDTHQVSSERGMATVRPSIAVCDAPCKAHYFITAGHVEWLPAFSDAMASSVMRNQIARHATVDAKRRPWTTRLSAAIARAFSKLKELFGV